MKNHGLSDVEKSSLIKSLEDAGQRESALLLKNWDELDAGAETMSKSLKSCGLKKEDDEEDIAPKPRPGGMSAFEPEETGEEPEAAPEPNDISPEGDESFDEENPEHSIGKAELPPKKPLAPVVPIRPVAPMTAPLRDPAVPPPAPRQPPQQPLQNAQQYDQWKAWKQGQQQQGQRQGQAEYEALDPQLKAHLDRALSRPQEEDKPPVPPTKAALDAVQAGHDQHLAMYQDLINHESTPPEMKQSLQADHDRLKAKGPQRLIGAQDLRKPKI